VAVAAALIAVAVEAFAAVELGAEFPRRRACLGEGGLELGGCGAAIQTLELGQEGREGSGIALESFSAGLAEGVVPGSRSKVEAAASQETGAKYEERQHELGGSGHQEETGQERPERAPSAFMRGHWGPRTRSGALKLEGREV
jgi:hypothetical protein